MKEKIKKLLFEYQGSENDVELMTEDLEIIFEKEMQEIIGEDEEFMTGDYDKDRKASFQDDLRAEQRKRLEVLLKK